MIHRYNPDEVFINEKLDTIFIKSVYIQLQENGDPIIDNKYYAIANDNKDSTVISNDSEDNSSDNVFGFMDAFDINSLQVHSRYTSDITSKKMSLDTEKKVYIHSSKPFGKRKILENYKGKVKYTKKLKDADLIVINKSDYSYRKRIFNKMNYTSNNTLLFTNEYKKKQIILKDYNIYYLHSISDIFNKNRFSYEYRYDPAKERDSIINNYHNIDIIFCINDKENLSKFIDLFKGTQYESYSSFIEKYFTERNYYFTLSFDPLTLIKLYSIKEFKNLALGFEIVTTDSYTVTGKTHYSSLHVQAKHFEELDSTNYNENNCFLFTSVAKHIEIDEETYDILTELYPKIIFDTTFLGESTSVKNIEKWNFENYQNIRKLFQSNDKNNISTAINLMANTDFNINFIYIYLLLYEFYARLRSIRDFQLSSGKTLISCFKEHLNKAHFSEGVISIFNSLDDSPHISRNISYDEIKAVYYFHLKDNITRPNSLLFLHSIGNNTLDIANNISVSCNFNISIEIPFRFDHLTEKHVAFSYSDMLTFFHITHDHLPTVKDIREVSLGLDTLVNKDEVC